MDIESKLKQIRKDLYSYTISIQLEYVTAHLII